MSIPEDSVGIVTPQRTRFDDPLVLQCGAVLPSHELVYETYGELNEARTNAVLICHALSGHHHAAGYHSVEDRKPGWWETCIGPGKPIDTNRFYVVSLNNLGGCHGSTGPRSIDPNTGRPFGPTFPRVTVTDWVASQARFSDQLGIEVWAAIIGGSLGGMQALQWAIDFPDRLRHAVLIACAPKLSAQNIAFNEIARQAIVSDREFHDGNYLDEGVNPDRGLMLARMVGHVTYQSDDGMRDKFGRELKSGDIALGRDVEFQVESYLHHQGRSFSQSFDANTYLLMTRALDYFDPARKFGDDLVAALSETRCNFLVTSFTSDWRFPPARSQEIVNALVAARRNVISTIIDCPHGHDAFLLPVQRYFDVLTTYLQRVASEVDAPR
ncbi:MAG: homoserine O-acetyltransferase [Gammaproteobacteria bacterium]|nr:MAG: homoserine O-acetyltransferase [Gammaproteobacteria bacterium]